LEYAEKISRAEEIIAVLKDEILYILWNTDLRDISNLRYMIPMFGEQAKYDIADLGLKEKDLILYEKKVDQALGVYHDFFPCLKVVDDG